MPIDWEKLRTQTPMQKRDRNPYQEADAARVVRSFPPEPDLSKAPEVGPVEIESLEASQRPSDLAPFKFSEEGRAAPFILSVQGRSYPIRALTLAERLQVQKKNQGP